MRCPSCEQQMVKTVMSMCENNCTEYVSYDQAYYVTLGGNKRTHHRITYPMAQCKCGGHMDTWFVWDCSDCGKTIYSESKRHPFGKARTEEALPYVLDILKMARNVLK